MLKEPGEIYVDLDIQSCDGKWTGQTGIVFGADFSFQKYEQTVEYIQVETYTFERDIQFNIDQNYWKQKSSWSLKTKQPTTRCTYML